MQCWPLRSPFRASRRLPGWTRRSSSRPAIRSCRSFLRATYSMSTNRLTRLPLASFTVAGPALRGVGRGRRRWLCTPLIALVRGWLRDGRARHSKPHFLSGYRAGTTSSPQDDRPRGSSPTLGSRLLPTGDNYLDNHRSRDGPTSCRCAAGTRSSGSDTNGGLGQRGWTHAPSACSTCPRRRPKKSRCSVACRAYKFANRSVPS